MEEKKKISFPLDNLPAMAETIRDIGHAAREAIAEQRKEGKDRDVLTNTLLLMY